MNPVSAVHDQELGPTLTSTYGRVTALRRNRTALLVGPILANYCPLFPGTYQI